jgi:hypothetical protein
MHIFAAGRPHRAAAPASEREALIRTLSVSLVAIAAIAASLLLARSRDEGEDTRLAPADEGQPARFQLDAIRAAGL